ncbi:MAG: IgGFc-binding protein [Deltaproteobacteria bacterium]|nr:IgGFc-binding protein [Deltaproteobacteria bacterium]
MSLRFSGWVAAAVAVLALGCSPADDTTGDPDARDGVDDGRDGADADADVTWDDGTAETTDRCTPGAIECEGSRMQVCNAAGTGWEAPVACADPTPACTPGFGCTVCAGGTGGCEGDTARMCTPDGSGWFADDFCDPALGERCDGGYCTDLSGACEDARRNRSYEGCDYFVTETVNSTMLGPDVFRFAIVVGNRNVAAAHVQVFDGDVEVGSADVASNGTASIELDWKPALRSPRGSSIVAGGAFRVRSDLPVTVYQFNPLRYWEESRPIYPGSYTNDASLVLPRNVLSGRYVVAARESFKKVEVDSEGIESTTPIPGFAAIVATRDDTRVTVTFSAHTQGIGVAAQSPGDTAEYTLHKGDVLQLLSQIPDDCPGSNWAYTPAGVQAHYCEVGPEYDLTGTTVAANKPVSVFGGHDCTFVPHDRWACDHLEEQIFPAESLGRRYIGSASQSIRGEGNVWRIVSAAEGNEVTFTPAAAHAPMTLGHGEHREFESTDDFLVTGTGPLLLVQYLTGEGDDMDSIGDPSMGLAVPIEQFRTDYNFLSPEDYRDEGPRQVGQNWINLIVPAGATTWLDGVEQTDFTAIGASGYGVARIQVPGGSHTLTGPEKIGVMCYGYGNYTSYLYPGGLNVDPINTVIIF